MGRSDVLDTHMGFAILRLREGLDYSDVVRLDSEEVVQKLSLIRNDSESSIKT